MILFIFSLCLFFFFFLQVSDVGQGDKYKACHVCNMTFSSAVVAEYHYQGKVHAKNLRLKNFGPQTPGMSATLKLSSDFDVK